MKARSIHGIRRQKIKFSALYDPPPPPPPIVEEVPSAYIHLYQYNICTVLYDVPLFWGHVTLNYVDFIELSALLKKVAG
jgi:hypothetical protein